MSWLSPTFTVCRPLRVSILTGGIWLLVVVLIIIPPVIIRCWMACPVAVWVFFFFFLLLSIKDLRKFTCPTWLLESWLYLEIFLQNPPQDISWGQLSLTAPLVLWTGLAIKHCWSSCIHRKCPQDSSIFSCPTVVPGTQRSVGKTGFLGCELWWKVWANTQELVSHYFFPLKVHPPL